MLVFTTTLDDHEIRKHYERGFPMVLLHRTPPPAVFVPSVMFDNQAGLVGELAKVVKVIKNGEISRAIKFTGIGATAGAKAAIEAAGGSFA